MKKENLDDYQLFYAELSTGDYLTDIEIQDEYDTNDYDQIQGLTDQQIRQIEDDSRAAASKDFTRPSLEPTLFPGDQPAT